MVTRGHSWSFVVTRGHSWSLVCTYRQDQSETQSWSGCVSSDLSLLFFLKLFSTFFPAFLTLLRLTELGFGVGIGLSYKNSTLTTVTIYTAGHLVFKILSGCRTYIYAHLIIYYNMLICAI